MNSKMLLLAIGATVLLPAAASAADAAIAGRQVGEPASCLRWVWQQYSWYDDCWAARHPYIGGRAGVRAASRR